MSFCGEAKLDAQRRCKPPVVGFESRPPHPVCARLLLEIRWSAGGRCAWVL